jgi:hypothetical protein
MAITNGYATLAQFQAYANMSTLTAGETTTIEKAIESASRSIDRITNRRFYADSTAQQRFYRPIDWYRLDVDDISTTTGIEVAFDQTGNGNYTQVLTFQTDYILDPINAPQKAIPYTRVVMVGATTLPAPYSWRPAVRVTARYGWYNGVAPDDIVEATLILSADLFKRASSVGGVLGLSELGAIRMSPLGRDIAAMTRAYRRDVVA